MADEDKFERFKIWLQRWESSVSQSQQNGWDAEKIAAEFGRLGLQSAFLVNGGALVGLPALMQILNRDGKFIAAHQAGWFILGLILAALAVLAAYVNFMSLSGAHYAIAQSRASELNEEWTKPTDEMLKDRKGFDVKRDRYNEVVVATQGIAVLSAVFSFVVFGVGIYKCIVIAGTYFIAE